MRAQDRSSHEQHERIDENRSHHLPGGDGLRGSRAILALDHASFELGEDFAGLLGPNDAGKTTFVRILATLLGPDHGRVELLGRNPARTAERVAVRRRLGHLPQEPRFHRCFTIFEFLAYVGILKGSLDRRERHCGVRRVTDRVGLTDKSPSRIKSLSGPAHRGSAWASRTDSADDRGRLPDADRGPGSRRRTCG